MSPRLAAKRHVPTNYGQPVKTEDNQQALRERLYVAIRDAMAITGVLSASYKFKVLAVDSSAQSFLVMIDLNHIVGERAADTAELEMLIVQKARVMHNVLVSGVYWRINEVELPSKMNAARPVVAKSVLVAPSPIDTPAQPFSFKPADSKLSSTRQIEKVEQIDPEELTAFHHALRSASARSVANADAKTEARTKGAPTSPYEFGDTVMEEEEPEAVRYPALSSTQYGDL